MSRELLSVNEISDLSPNEPWRHTIARAMFPLWRSFELDQSDINRYEIIQNNSRDWHTSYNFIAKITGINAAAIDSYSIEGKVLTVAPFVTQEEFGDFLRSI